MKSRIFLIGLVVVAAAVFLLWPSVDEYIKGPFPTGTQEAAKLWDLAKEIEVICKKGKHRTFKELLDETSQAAGSKTGKSTWEAANPFPEFLPDAIYGRTLSLPDNVTPSEVPLLWIEKLTAGKRGSMSVWIGWDGVYHGRTDKIPVQDALSALRKKGFDAKLVSIPGKL